MEKQRMPAVFESDYSRQGKAFARTWDGVRGRMHGLQFPGQPHERIRRFQGLVEGIVPAKGNILIAAVGTGTPDLMGFETLPGRIAYRILLSDASPHMLYVLEENYPHLESKPSINMWDSIPEVHGKGKLAAVFITGASLGYAISWDEEKLHERAVDYIRDSIRAISLSLKKGGKFIFDLPKKLNENMRLGPGIYEGKKVEYYMDVSCEVDQEHAFAFRTATFGVTGEWQKSFTRHGVHLDLEIMNSMLSEAGLTEAKEVPKELQLDPMYYQLCYSEKKMRRLFVF